jgi:hypothetical protein
MADITSEEKLALSNIGVHLLQTLGDGELQYYFGKANENGEIPDSQMISAKDAKILAQKAIELEAQSKKVFNGNLENLLFQGSNSKNPNQDKYQISYSRDPQGDYLNSKGEVISPQELLQIAEVKRKNFVLDRGANFIKNYSFQGNLPTISEEDESKLSKYNAKKKTDETLTMKIAESQIAHYMIEEARAQKAIPRYPFEPEEMEIKFPININTGRCDKLPTLHNVLVEQNSETCKTIMKIGLLDSPNVPLGFGILIPLGR